MNIYRGLLKATKNSLIEIVPFDARIFGRFLLRMPKKAASYQVILRAHIWRKFFASACFGRLRAPELSPESP
jgi:hypothetical protein